MRRYRIVILKGDGIGPEVTAATRLVLEATGLEFEFDELEFGETSEGVLPEHVIEAIRGSDAAIKGPTGTPLGGGHRSLNVQLREEFKLRANFRPIRTMPGVWTPFSGRNLDTVVVRENLEDLYIGEERAIEGGFEAVSRFTVVGCTEISEFAFRYAANTGRKVIIGHKANILKLTHGLFLETAQKIGDHYGVPHEHFIADNLAMQLVMRPERFNSCVILLPNFLGDILSDEAAGLIGGLGFAPGANIGKEAAIFEAVHGSAPDIAGRGIANPSALIGSGALLLEHLEERGAALRVRNAVDAVLTQGRVVTADVNPTCPASTMEFAQAVADAVRE